MVRSLGYSGLLGHIYIYRGVGGLLAALWLDSEVQPLQDLGCHIAVCNWWWSQVQKQKVRDARAGAAAPLTAKWGALSLVLRVPHDPPTRKPAVAVSNR